MWRRSNFILFLSVVLLIICEVDSKIFRLKRQTGKFFNFKTRGRLGKKLKVKNLEFLEKKNC